MPKFEFKTKRLTVRPYKLSDFEFWKKAYLNLPKPKNKWDETPRTLSELSKANFKSKISTNTKNLKSDFMYDYCAFKKSTGELIGFVSVMDVSRAVFQNAYLGYRVFSPYWGKGYGKELVAGMMRHAFTTLKLHRLEAGIEPTNKRSVNLAKSLGLRHEGLSKRRLCLRGEWQDISIYAITCDELGFKPETFELSNNRR